MKSNRFYSIPYDNRNDFDIRRLRSMQGGIVAFGRWHALLGILYDKDGLVDASDAVTLDLLAEELDFRGNKSRDKVCEFLGDCATIGLIDLTAWTARRHVVCSGVVEVLDFRSKKSNAGGKGGRGKKKGSEEAAETCEE